jgi:hypothetical protein
VKGRGQQPDAWVTVRRLGDGPGGVVYLAHAVPAGWRYAPRDYDGTFPVWRTLPAAEFWRAFERVTEPL